MAMPFFNRRAAKTRDQMVAVDLGTRTTKAVYLQRRNGDFALRGFAVLDAPIFDKVLSPELLGEQLKTIAQTLQAKTKLVTLTAGVSDAVVRTVDTPHLPMDQLRSVLKHNSRNYMQQELPNYVFDGHVLQASTKSQAVKPNQSADSSQKQKVLVAGVKKQLVDDYVEGAKGAGLAPDHIVPGLIGPVNAFEMAMPDLFAGESVALVDIGFKNTSICILQKGELALSRIVGIGGDRMTAGLSESMSVSYAEAEGIKVGMPQEVRPALESVLTPLGRELRASIDFFEHQQDKVVGRVFVSGGSARSEAVMQTLQNELLVECKTWDPTGFLRQELPAEQSAELAEVGPALTVAVGAALAAL